MRQVDTGRGQWVSTERTSHIVGSTLGAGAYIYDTKAAEVPRPSLPPRLTVLPPEVLELENLALEVDIEWGAPHC